MKKKKSPRYLLDECIPYTLTDAISQECVKHSDILKPGISDEKVLSEATKRKLVVVTIDRKFVLNTIFKNQDIVIQDTDGKRHYVTSTLLGTVSSTKGIKNSTRYLLENDMIILP